MNRRSIHFVLIFALLAALLNTSSLALAGRPERPLAQAGAPHMVSYQGQVTVGGLAYNGTGYFKFAVVEETGSTVYWTNDGSLAIPPTAAVTITVSGGLFNVLLGDPAAGMAYLPAAAFDGPDRYLQVWFSSDGTTFTLLSPNRRIAAVPYALQAEEAKNAFNATTLGGQPASAFIRQGQADSITTTMIISGG